METCRRAHRRKRTDSSRILGLFKSLTFYLTKCEPFIFTLIMSKNTSEVNFTPFCSSSNFLQLPKVEHFAS